MGKRQLWFNANSKHKEAWNDIFRDLQKYGIRNSQISAIAPNTSSSLIQGCSASVLPVYSKFFVETHGKGSIPNCPPFIKDKFWFYQENRNINQKVVIEVMSRINKWIDTGISIELMYNLNRNIRARDIYETIMDAWKKILKPFIIRGRFRKTVRLPKKANVSAAPVNSKERIAICKERNFLTSAETMILPTGGWSAAM